MTKEQAIYLLATEGLVDPQGGRIIVDTINLVDLFDIIDAVSDHYKKEILELLENTDV